MQSVQTRVAQNNVPYTANVHGKKRANCGKAQSEAKLAKLIGITVVLKL